MGTYIKALIGVEDFELSRDGVATFSRTNSSGGSLQMTKFRYHHLLDNVYNVKDFGAVGDDTTDDSAAIQAAITAAADAGGGTVLFPPAWYLVETGLTHTKTDGSVADNVSYVGVSGSGTHGAAPGAEIRTNVPGLTILTIGDITSTTRHKKGGIIREIGFGVKLGNGAETDSSTRGVHFVNVGGWTIQDCALRNFYLGAGMHFQGYMAECERHWVYNLRGFNNRHDVKISGHATDISFYGGHFQGYGSDCRPDKNRYDFLSAGIYCESDQGRRIYVDGTLVTNKRWGVFGGCIQNSHIDVTVEADGAAFHGEGCGVFLHGDEYRTVELSSSPESFAANEAITWNGGASAGVVTALKGTTLTYRPSVAGDYIESGDTVIGGTIGTETAAADDEDPGFCNNNKVVCRGNDIRNIVTVDSPFCEDCDVTVFGENMPVERTLTQLTGLCSVTNATPTVIGAGTDWLDQLGFDDVVYFQGSELGDQWRSYSVLVPGSDAILSLASNYVGETDASTTVFRDDTRRWFIDEGTRTRLNGRIDAYDATAFGAKGDGATDDTEAIRQAVNAAWRGGNPLLARDVILAGGEHLFSETIYVPEYVRLRGLNRGTSVLRAASGFSYTKSPGDTSNPLGIKNAAVVVGDMPFHRQTDLYAVGRYDRLYAKTQMSRVTTKASGSSVIQLKIYGHAFATGDVIRFKQPTLTGSALDGIPQAEFYRHGGFLVTKVDSNTIEVDLGGTNATTGSVAGYSADFLEWTGHKDEAAMACGLSGLTVKGQNTGQDADSVGVYARRLQGFSGVRDCDVHNWGHLCIWYEEDSTVAASLDKYVIAKSSLMLSYNAAGTSLVDQVACARIDGGSANGAVLVDIEGKVQQGAAPAYSAAVILCGVSDGTIDRVTVGGVATGVQVGAVRNSLEDGNTMATFCRSLVIGNVSSDDANVGKLIHVLPYDDGTGNVGTSTATPTNNVSSAIVAINPTPKSSGSTVTLQDQSSTFNSGSGAKVAIYASSTSSGTNAPEFLAMTGSGLEVAGMLAASEKISSLSGDLVFEALSTEIDFSNCDIKNADIIKANTAMISNSAAGFRVDISGTPKIQVTSTGISSVASNDLRLTAASGEIDANTSKIKNLGTPTSNTDAATKLYADTIAANANAVMVKKIEGWLTAADCSGGAATVAIGTVPADAIVFAVLRNTTEGFNGATSNDIEVGYSGDNNAYLMAQDVTSTGKEYDLGGITADAGVALGAYDGTSRVVNVTYAGGSNPTTGKVHVAILYMEVTTEP